MQTMRRRLNFNNDWIFSEGFRPEMAGEIIGGVDVTLPHNAVDLPLTYLDETSYQRAFLYQKRFTPDPEDATRETILRLDGAMADTEVFLNGNRVHRHRDGYTPIEVRLTEHLLPGENVISVKVDGSENPEIPPFGGQIDYLCYAGIYRDVWLEICDPVHLSNIWIRPEDVLSVEKRVVVTARLSNSRNLPLDGTLSVELFSREGLPVASLDAPITGDEVQITLKDLRNIELWSLDHPHLYTARVRLTTRDGSTDEIEAAFGFRTAEFMPSGFFLNGEKVVLCGLNRHQSFPYVGYAMGRAAQERDAEILKSELHVNVVRCSHYPQSPYFLDACDRLGLMVLEEIPGWQHIGGEAWQIESLRNVERMILRDRNHPSIIQWGVRINESADNRDFYKKTNALAHALDPTRATGGIRCIEDSEFLEDVYTMNDFFHVTTDEIRGNRAPTPLRTPAEVTGLDRPVPYMVTEFNGHMFPTKRTDSEERQAEHVMRYLQVLNHAYGDPGISGAIGWCMFDYNTHKDFGSGDRICHHGVLDIFREPKFAAWVYKSQVDPSVEAVLKPVTYWARGERSVGGALPLIVLTNCDYIEFQYGDRSVKRIYPDRDQFPNLPFAPVIIDNRSLSPAEAGDWGMRWEDARFIGYVDHQVVTETRLSAAPLPTTLDLEADAVVLNASEGEEVRLILRAKDQCGQILPYLDDIAVLDVSGPAELIGPETLPLRGGVAGAWLRATGPGAIAVTVLSKRFGSATLTLDAI